MRVVVGEDNALLRDGLIRILEAYGIEVVGAVGTETEVRALLGCDGSASGPGEGESRGSADLAILDVRMPPTLTDEGLRAAIDVRAVRPGFPVLVLSQYVEHLYARELLASGEGAVGYLLKDRVSDVGAFVQACRSVAGGGTVLDPEVVASVLGAARARPLDRLTPREREVLALMAEGRSNAAIAAALFVAEKSVVKYTASIFDKLDLPVSADDNRRVRAVLAYLRP